MNALTWQPCHSPLRTDLAAGNGSDVPSTPFQDEGAERANPARGLHAMLVEDQTIIALDTESMLRELGAANVDAFTTADTALAWLASAEPNVAVLDVNLGASDSFAVAEALRARSIPLLFTTGYDDSAMIPANFVGVPIVRKPYTVENLATALSLCLSRPRCA